eukprot:SAG31_NODE_2116_length_6414_cov_2.444181_3_plen_611_part_00
MDCNWNGACNNGTCSCSDDFRGPSCGLTPENYGSCNLQAGLCFDTSSPVAAPFGIRNASAVQDCCYMCDQLASCSNFTYNKSWVFGDNPQRFPPGSPDGNCVLIPSASSVSFDTSCISGGIAGHMILPCRSDKDCNDQGTCTEGNCACSPGFTGALCQFVIRDEGNCTVTEGQCSAGSPAFTNDQTTKTLDACCYQCSKFSQCHAFTWNKTDSMCKMQTALGTITLSDECTTGISPPRGESTCNAQSLHTGVALTGGEIKPGQSAKTLGECCQLCEGLSACANFTFDLSSMSCTLHNPSATANASDTAISGSSGIGALPCRSAKGMLDCNQAGACTADGTCVCNKGFTGPNCASAPDTVGGCVMTAGTCFTGTEVFGSAAAKDASDCCYLCNQMNGPNIELAAKCTNFTFNATDNMCHLFNAPSTSLLDDVCVSGYSPGHKDLACRDGNAMDCNNMGTCDGGKCTCKGSYTGKSCEFVPNEKCKIKAGQCLTGAQIGGFGADDVGNCCHGCTHFPGCTNFTFNSSSSICSLHSSVESSILSSECTTGEVTPNLPPPPPAPTPAPPTPAPPTPPTPPPAKKYKCDGGSPAQCIEAEDGSYDSDDCDNKCTR